TESEKKTLREATVRPFGVPALAGSDRLKAGLQTCGVTTDRFMVPMMRKTKGGLHEREPVPDRAPFETKSSRPRPAGGRRSAPSWLIIGEHGLRARAACPAPRFVDTRVFTV